MDDCSITVFGSRRRRLFETTNNAKGGRLARWSPNLLLCELCDCGSQGVRLSTLSHQDGIINCELGKLPALHAQVSQLPELLDPRQVEPTTLP